MSHEINRLAPGVDSFVSAREHAWHRLGVTLDGAFDAHTALKTAHLADWDVRKIGLTASELTSSGVTSFEVPDRWATVYTNPVTKATQYIGVVGSHYAPIQNEAHADLLNAVVGEGGAHFETAGSLRGGRETFITMKLPETVLIGGADPVDTYLVALNSHDGTSAFRFLVTPVRVVCANTQAAALRTAKASFSVRHTANNARVVQEAREALGLTFKYMEEFEAEAEKMIQKSITDAAFQKIVGRLFDADKATTERQRNLVLDHVGGVMSLWNGGSDTMTGIKGTRWGGYQALTEYTDHFMSVRAAGSHDEARALRAATGTKMTKLKAAAFDLLSV